jgi:hypothetical protein
MTHKLTAGRTSVSISFTTYFFSYWSLKAKSVPGTREVGAALCLELLDDGLPEGLILLICPLSQQEMISTPTHTSPGPSRLWFPPSSLTNILFVSHFKSSTPET